MIPDGLTRKHILWALHEILREGVPERRRSTGYCLVYEDRHFPPKYVISLACIRMTGIEPDPHLFWGGYETNSTLQRLGFNIVVCHCGGLRGHGGAGTGTLARGDSDGAQAHPSDSGSRSRTASRAATPIQGGPQITESVYSLLYTLPRRDHLALSAQIPENGVYIFFEQGERITCRGLVMDRVVRIGSHREDSGLRGRLRDHFGPPSDLSGSRSVSVLRTHVGVALMARANPADWRLREWRAEDGATFPDVERLISQTLRANFSFVCIRVDDRLERLSLESSLIAIFARYPLGPPSPGWLGRHADQPGIRESGLWNVHHLDDAPLTQTGLARLEGLIRAT